MVIQLAICSLSLLLFLFFFNDTATTEIYTLSLHDALPISHAQVRVAVHGQAQVEGAAQRGQALGGAQPAPVVVVAEHDRSEEHTSELQSQSNLVCRLLLEKKTLPLLPNDTSVHPLSAGCHN